MFKGNNLLFGIFIVVFLTITMFPAANINAANDTSWEASLAYGKKVTIMQGTVYKNASLQGLTDGDITDHSGKYFRLNKDSIGADRWAWVEIDLGKEEAVNYFKVYTRKLYKASLHSYIKTIRIEGAENRGLLGGKTFKTIIPDSSPESGEAYPGDAILEFKAATKVTARYIRLWLQIVEEKVGEQPATYNLREFGVYNIDESQIKQVSQVSPELQVTESIPYSKEDFHLYLFIGQSNMSGRANIEDEDRVIVERAYLFNKEGKWEPAQPGIARGANPSLQGYNRYSTVEVPGKENGLNPAHTFAKAITQNKKDIGVGIISNAIGNTHLRQWQKGSGSNYFEEAVRRTKEAMKYGTLKGILWHQGEGDVKNSQYLEELKVFVADLREALGVNADTVPFVAGQCLPTDKYSAFNNRIINIKNFVPNSDYISSPGTTDIGDATHFDSKSQRILGERYAAKILKMVYGIEIPAKY